jgi:hypothetical protein
MKHITEDLYKKITRISDQVRNELRLKGFVVPVEHRDGSISVGRYTIKKTSDNFYSIMDYKNEIVVSKINLPQTAAIVANGLALGKFLDKDIIQEDRYYGYALFEEELHTRTLQKGNKISLDKYGVSLSKYTRFKTKKELHRREIIKSFEKLRKIA